MGAGCAIALAAQMMVSDEKKSVLQARVMYSNDRSPAGKRKQTLRMSAGSPYTAQTRAYAAHRDFGASARAHSCLSAAMSGNASARGDTVPWDERANNRCDSSNARIDPRPTG